MKYDETITEINMRYTEMVNGLAYQGKTFTTNAEDVNKILIALPMEWNYMKTFI